MVALLKLDNKQVKDTNAERKVRRPRQDARILRDGKTAADQALAKFPTIMAHLAK